MCCGKLAKPSKQSSAYSCWYGSSSHLFHGTENYNTDNGSFVESKENYIEFSGYSCSDKAEFIDMADEADMADLTTIVRFVHVADKMVQIIGGIT